MTQAASDALLVSPVFGGLRRFGEAVAGGMRLALKP